MYALGFLLNFVKQRREALDLMVLTLLKEHGPSSWLELVERSKGRLYKGTLYERLRRMENEKSIKSWMAPQGVGLPEPFSLRMYDLTDKGRQKLEETDHGRKNP
ncbi:MAG: helix-turn-helix transcriptional regulator [Candidatus Aenigmarchaeota archaeon]|nr:helix-turn-helix transcriptional regulator [Candidatus Aenigmarchaeota archaeon]